MKNRSLHTGKRKDTCFQVIQPSPKRKKRISLKQKLLFIFGSIIATSIVIESVLAFFIAKQAVTEKIKIHLTDKAEDTAQIIDSKLLSCIQFLEGIARDPELQNPNLTYPEKTARMIKKASFNEKIEFFGIYDPQGIRYSNDSSSTYIGDRDWFKEAIKGNRFIAEPRISRTTNTLQMIFSVPIYEENEAVIAVLSAGVSGKFLTNEIENIVIGKTGECYVLGLTGTTIADRDFSLVERLENGIEESKTNNALAGITQFEQVGLSDAPSTIGFYDYKWGKTIASFATIPTTSWKVFVHAPYEEFMGIIDKLHIIMYLAGFGILIIATLILFYVSHQMVKPILATVNALKDIANGEGDLTVQLPLLGNDEVTDLSDYFNQTIIKIGSTIKMVGENSSRMNTIGSNLATNMAETASAIHQINANIEGVKQQALTQASSVSQTASTIEEIIRTIQQLSSSIENQATSVTQSSCAIEEMVANIGSITRTLGSTDDVIKRLAKATNDGKETISQSNTVTQRIAQESGSLIEASNVIQHIADQTNLLAMNAAIEAAHAGEAGKGFAVVADEIRKLAEESSMQGKSITDTLEVLSQEIEMLSQSAHLAEEKFSIIFTLSDQVKEMSNSLIEAMKEQENGSQEVLEAIRNINSVTLEVQAGSEEMLHGGEDVVKEIKQLDQLTRIIVDSMNEMASGAVQIQSAVEDVNLISQKNKESIENLSFEVKKFKIQ